MPDQNPAMFQWQSRFDRALAASQRARTSQEKAAASEQLRQLQISKPTGPTPQGGGAFGRDSTRSKEPSGGTGLAPFFNYIRNALERSK